MLNVQDNILEMLLKERGFSLVDLNRLNELKPKRISKKELYAHTTNNINIKTL